MSYLTKCNEMAKAVLESLPSDLSFHNIAHTKYVVEGVEIIGKRSYDLSKEEIEILKIAAWYHDTGYIKQKKNHEKLSQKLAEQYLKTTNYSPDKIRKVCDCIRATDLDKTPKTKLEKVLCDADLRHLSDPNYLKFAELLRKELEDHFNYSFTDRQWLEGNVSFLSDHRYHTPYGHDVLEKRKQVNITKLKNLLFSI